MRKICSKLHLWLSIPLGLFIAIVCFTGALLVFEDEINHLTDPKLYYVESVGEQTLEPQALAALVQATLDEDTQVTGITTSDSPKKTWMVALSKPHHAQVAVNPYTGEVLGRVERKAFFANVLKIHRYLFHVPAERGQMSVGKFIVGVSVLVMVFILITGLIWWIPAKGGNWKGRFAISFKGGSRKFWHQLHHAGGVYVLIFLLIMALTGLTWSFGWYRTGFYALFGGENQMEMRGEGPRPEGRGEGPRGEGRGEGFHGRRGEGRPEGMAEARPEGKPEGFHGRRGQGRPEGVAQNAAELKVSKDTDRPNNLKGWIYQLHTGRWGGIFSKILYFIACLVGATLPITGYWFWISRKKKK